MPSRLRVFETGERPRPRLGAAARPRGAGTYQRGVGGASLRGRSSRSSSALAQNASGRVGGHAMRFVAGAAIGGPSRPASLLPKARTPSRASRTLDLPASRPARPNRDLPLPHDPATRHAASGASRRSSRDLEGHVERLTARPAVDEAEPLRAAPRRPGRGSARARGRRRRARSRRRSSPPPPAKTVADSRSPKRASRLGDDDVAGERELAPTSHGEALHGRESGCVRARTIRASAARPVRPERRKGLKIHPGATSRRPVTTPARGPAPVDASSASA